ncbi:MAG: hypothetical protein D6805_09245 [Planctomycetota bacterium]|nr:MAG: hypothetical protein D6805_09245 [Planctomycetota bacterium]
MKPMLSKLPEKIWAIPLLLIGCATTPSQQAPLILEYNPKTDKVNIIAKQQPLLKIIQDFQKKIYAELHYEPDLLKKKISCRILKANPYNALKKIVKLAGLTLVKSRIGLGYQIRQPWRMPQLSKRFLEKIQVITTPSQANALLKLYDQTLYRPLPAWEEKSYALDIYSAYRPLLEKKLLEKVPYLRKIGYHLPKSIPSQRQLRGYFDPNGRAIIVELLLGVNAKTRVHIFMYFGFRTLQVKQIAMLTTALANPFRSHPKANLSSPTPKNSHSPGKPREKRPK